MTTQRLFAAAGTSIADHRAEFGELPAVARDDLVRCLDEAGLTGRGGAGFPTGRKVDSLSGQQPVVIGNGAEGEPLSAKDVTLLARAPHLVLDGLTLTANALAAQSVFLYVPPQASAVVQAALRERQQTAADRCRIAVVEAPDDFLAGEESAVVSRIEGGPALPRDRTALPTRSGVRGRPTLVSNVETFAHVALIARYGPDWFRSVGDSTQPGTMLATVSATFMPTTVVEVPTGIALGDLVARTESTDPRRLQALLVGGYHGSWIPADVVGQARLSKNGLAAFGAAPGAGVIHLLGSDECGLARTAEVAAYLADQSAQQCGPCRYGLPKLSMLLDELAFGEVDDDLVGELHRMVGLVDGRGSCRHPDGTARFVRSALAVFESDIDHHRRGCCQAARDIAVGEAR
ncbi:NADH-ubiquinone oxidoreductase-F iron-sulfur binding region domain-containing protein [Mycolicibacterium sp. P1-5]|uniref:NADH-ubiquinone oxidoreductase-F iron-sulfur binding region domain-containing protein n=1 Tax=Mycolicibacterium sp. P1-5 TaxID=2024617 RepID=UPI0011EDAB2A|nr:NADH-ubiquinone oxidoreductase-F iron-sulfur binding region domain-containing protein [Mycolicibacterium sp. P1-5]KAA0112080.1 NADH-quinone oxidoreductase subunit F [Mycolicibacterium sp. P1-5]